MPVREWKWKESFTKSELIYILKDWSVAIFGQSKNMRCLSRRIDKKSFWGSSSNSKLRQRHTLIQISHPSFTIVQKSICDHVTQFLNHEQMMKQMPFIQHLYNPAFQVASNNKECLRCLYLFNELCHVTAIFWVSRRIIKPYWLCQFTFLPPINFLRQEA